LSGSGQIACTSYHDPDLGFADGRTVSFDHSRKEFKRNAPSILNAGQLHALSLAFMDGLFHNEGLSYHGRSLQDLGRYKRGVSLT
jgi:cytochrome c peroxidase